MRDEAAAEHGAHREMRCGGAKFRWGERTYVMGVVNATPDSFSGDGLGNDPNAAAKRALEMEENGADVIDIGGESTRPAGPVYGEGGPTVTAEEELARVLPVIARLAGKLQIPISIDTYKADVAHRAIEEGAAMINDVWGLKADPELADVAANHGVPLALMHNQRTGDYQDFLPDVMASLRNSLSIALKAGVEVENLMVDPGIGFGKTPDYNLEVLRRLPEFRNLGYPLLIGTSRKSTIGLVLGLPPEQRLEGTAATVALSIAGKADMVRVHDVKEMVRVARMSDSIVRGWRPASWPR